MSRKNSWYNYLKYITHLRDNYNIKYHSHLAVQN